MPAPSAGAPWSRVDVGPASVVFLYPADGMARAMWLAPSDTPLPVADELTADAWLHSEVRSGIASIGNALSDAFVPQMLNY